jgi:hypothetical protein
MSGQSIWVSGTYDDKEIAAIIQTFLKKAVFAYVVAFRKIPRAGFFSGY